jgi:hypothetical protein
VSDLEQATAAAKAEGWGSLAHKHFALLAWRIYGVGGPIPGFWADQFKAAK